MAFKTEGRRILIRKHGLFFIALALQNLRFFAEHKLYLHIFYLFFFHFAYQCPCQGNKVAISPRYNFAFRDKNPWL